MRTLKEEILYQKEKGYLHNSIDHQTLLAWYGEQLILEDELKKLKALVELKKFGWDESNKNNCGG